jgi:hypothetical protein
VKSLLPELEVPLPAAATIQLPQLTPQTAALLRPQFWQLASAGDKGWTRDEVTKIAAQNEQGRLEIKLPEDAGATWIVFARKAGANFGIRLYLTGVPRGQQFGLLDAKDTTPAATVDLPAGTVLVELARQRGEFICRINGEDAKLTIADEKAAKAATTFGLTAPAGAAITLAGLEAR